MANSLLLLLEEVMVTMATNLQSCLAEGAMVLYQSCFALLCFPHRSLVEQLARASLRPALPHDDCSSLKNKADTISKKRYYNLSKITNGHELYQFIANISTNGHCYPISKDLPLGAGGVKNLL